MDTSVVRPPFTVTPRAVDAIAELGGALRLDPKDGGCCGKSYAFSIPTEERPGDVRYSCKGAWLVVSVEAGAVLEGARLDYGANLRPARFRVTRNPNTDNVCAWRRSFGDPWPGPRQPTCRFYRPMPWDTEYDPPVEWQRRTGWQG